MAKTPLPPLAALRAFEAAARHGSFGKAADELSLTQSAVSHHVANIEGLLRIKLFRRLGRRVELTEAGAQYYPFLRDAFDRIAQGTALVSRATAGGDLTVQVYVTVAVRWLIPRLLDFQSKFPDILVRLSASHLDWDFDVETSDLGIIYAREPVPAGLGSVHLFDARLCLVCSPALLRDGPPIRAVTDLAPYPLLELYTAAEDWTVWLAGVGAPDMKRRPAAKFDSYLLALEAAADGQGIAVVPRFLAAADLRAGRLVQPIDIDVRQPGGWYLVCRAERINEPRIVRFRDWLKAEIDRDPIFS